MKVGARRGLERPLALAALFLAVLTLGGGALWLLKDHEAQQNEAFLALATRHYEQQIRGQMDAVEALKPRLPECPANDRACATAALRVHAARELNTWRAGLERPLETRITLASPLLINYLQLANIEAGFSQQPRVAAPDDAFLADLRAALRTLPAEVLRAVEPKLAGIALVEDLGGTGFSETVMSADGQHAAAFVVLDVGVLAARSANEWARWKESSPFAASPEWNLQAVIENGSEDNRRQAIQYILLHELGHVVAAGTRLHPWPALAPESIGSPADYSFLALSWTVPAGENRYAGLEDRRFPLRTRVVYYGIADLEAREMEAVYAQLEASSFPTLYAATHPADDFAESFANYVHVERMGRPFQIELQRSGQVVRRYASCWRQPRCAAKRAQLEQLLGAP